jgi:hypothetical protein
MAEQGIGQAAGAVVKLAEGLRLAVRDHRRPGPVQPDAATQNFTRKQDIRTAVRRAAPFSRSGR